MTATVTATSTVTASPSETTLSGGEFTHPSNPCGSPARANNLADLGVVDGGGEANASATLLGHSYPKAVRLNCDARTARAPCTTSAATRPSRPRWASPGFVQRHRVGRLRLRDQRLGEPDRSPRGDPFQLVTKLSVDISGQDQVKIACVMTKTGSEGKSYFTTALGDAVLIA